MITYSEDSARGIVEMTLDGKVTRESFDEIAGKLGPLMDAQGKIGILKRIVSFGGIEPSALWEDFKFVYRHLRHVGAVAVVADKKWIEVWVKLASPFFKAESRFFEEDEVDEARDWLVEATARARREVQAT